MKRTRSLLGAVAILAAVGLVAAGCGKDKSSSSSNASTTTAAEAPQGGELVIGAEQEPDCADWVGTCGGSSWGYWMMQVNTMPRAFDVQWDGNEVKVVHNPMLTGEPKLESSPKQVVTYTIDPKAVWSDGTPITSSDFKYTWDQVANGKDIYDKTGYDKIESVDDSKPDTAVVTFKENYAGCKQLFGGGFGIMPSHLLQGKDRDAEMKDGYTWSAGPFKIEKWEKGIGITLVPNDKFWGAKPKLDKVTFKFVTDTAAEFQAIKAGEVSAVYPQPQLDAVEQIKAGVPGVKSSVNAKTGNLEAMWINNAKAPFDSKEVRQAFFYAFDRDAIVNKLFGGLGVTKAVNSLEPALVAEFTDLEAFSGYKKDLGKVDELMKGAGWAKGSDGIWAKGGQRATVAFKTTAGNARRELTQQIVQEQAKAAGFEITIANEKAGDLFGKTLPGGDFQMALYAQVLTFPVPGACTLFCIKNNPDKNESKSGQNWTRTDIPSADADLQAVDTELDTTKQADAGKRGMKALAEDATSLPLDPLPNILLWADKVAGPVSDNPVLGPFWNLADWGVKK